MILKTHSGIFWVINMDYHQPISYNSNIAIASIKTFISIHQYWNFDLLSYFYNHSTLQVFKLNIFIILNSENKLISTTLFWFWQLMNRHILSILHNRHTKTCSTLKLEPLHQLKFCGKWIGDNNCKLKWKCLIGKIKEKV